MDRSAKAVEEHSRSDLRAAGIVDRIVDDYRTFRGMIAERAALFDKCRLLSMLLGAPAVEGAVRRAAKLSIETGERFGDVLDRELLILSEGAHRSPDAVLLTAPDPIVPRRGFTALSTGTVPRG